MTGGGNGVVHHAGVNASTFIGEREALLASVEDQRQHVVSDLDGLDEEKLRRAVLPSRWNCLGLLGHLTNDVERFWFRCVVAGEQDTIEKMMSDTNSGRPQRAANPVRSLPHIGTRLPDQTRSSPHRRSMPDRSGGLKGFLGAGGSRRYVRSCYTSSLKLLLTRASSTFFAEPIDGKQWVVQT